MTTLQSNCMLTDLLDSERVNWVASELYFFMRTTFLLFMCQVYHCFSLFYVGLFVI